jgi:transposase-like protein
LKIEHNHNINELIQFCNDNHNKIIPIKYKPTNNKVNTQMITNQVNNDTIQNEIVENNTSDELISDDDTEINKIYTCKRCGYSLSLFSLKRHLKRTRKCNIILEDVSIDILLNELQPIYSKSIIDEFGNKRYGCKYCNKTFPLNPSKSRHEKSCKIKSQLIVNNNTDNNMDNDTDNDETLNNELHNSKIDNQILQNENKYLLSVIELLKSKK